MRSGVSFSFAVASLQWFRFDDGLVRPVSEVEVLSTEAYCLFYHRMDEPQRQCSSSSGSRTSGPHGRSPGAPNAGYHNLQ